MKPKVYLTEGLRCWWHGWFKHFMFTMWHCFDEGRWLGAVCSCGARFGDRSIGEPPRQPEGQQ